MGSGSNDLRYPFLRPQPALLALATPEPSPPGLPSQLAPAARVPVELESLLTPAEAKAAARPEDPWPQQGQAAERQLP